MTKIQSFVIFMFFGLIFYYLLLVTPATAQESSSTPSGSLLEKINILKNEIASKAAQLKLEVNKKIQNKALTGIAKEKTSNEITLETKNGDKTIIVNEYTIYESKAKKPSLNDLDNGDYIAALGDMDDKNNLVAKKIVWLQKPADEINVAFWGQVESINGNIIDIKGRGGVQTLLTNGKTTYGVDNDEAALEDIKVKKYISGIGTKDSENKVHPHFIYIIPTGGSLSASSSAKLSK